MNKQHIYITFAIFIIMVFVFFVIKHSKEDLIYGKVTTPNCYVFSPSDGTLKLKINNKNKVKSGQVLATVNSKNKQEEIIAKCSGEINDLILDNNSKIKSGNLIAKINEMHKSKISFILQEDEKAKIKVGNQYNAKFINSTQEPIRIEIIEKSAPIVDNSYVKPTDIANNYQVKTYKVYAIPLKKDFHLFDGEELYIDLNKKLGKL